MVIYQLQSFPAVCVHCLRPVVDEEAFTSVESYHDALQCTIEQKSAELLGDFKIMNLAEIYDLLPNQICRECLEAIVAFHQYQSNLKCIRGFSFGLANLLRSNGEHLTELFSSQGQYLVQLLKNLDICRGSEEEITVEKIMEEIKFFKFYNKGENEGKRTECKTPYHQTIDENLYSENSENPLLAIEHQQPREINAHRGETGAREKKRKKGEKNSLKIRTGGTNLYNKRDDRRQLNKHAVDTKVKKGKCSSPRKTTELDGSEQRCKCQYDFCEETFPDRTTMRKHAREHHKTFECGICGCVHQFYSQYKRHMERHMPSHLFVCEYCNAQHSTKQELLSHLQSVHIVNPNKERQCGVCGMIFQGKQRLHRHMLSHKTERNHVCALCSMSFKTSTHLKRHAGVHQDSRYQCTFCEVTYGRRDKMRAHLEIAHHIQSYFVCEVCLVSFETDVLLQQHLARHRNPKPLECGTCLGVYLSKDDFADHGCITYQESYECCGKDFRYHTFYNKHMMIEHGIKTNVRVKLPKGRLLSEYRANRPSVKPLVCCDECNLYFETKIAFKRHQKACSSNFIASNTGLESLSIELLTEVT